MADGRARCHTLRRRGGPTREGRRGRARRFDGGRRRRLFGLLQRRQEEEGDSRAYDSIPSLLARADATITLLLDPVGLLLLRKEDS